MCGRRASRWTCPGETGHAPDAKRRDRDATTPDHQNSTHPPNYLRRPNDEQLATGPVHRHTNTTTIHRVHHKLHAEVSQRVSGSSQAQPARTPASTKHELRGRRCDDELGLLLPARRRLKQERSRAWLPRRRTGSHAGLRAATARVVAESAIAFVANQSPASGEPQQRMGRSDRACGAAPRSESNRRRDARFSAHSGRLRRSAWMPVATSKQGLALRHEARSCADEATHGVISLIWSPRMSAARSGPRHARQTTQIAASSAPWRTSLA